MGYSPGSSGTYGLKVDTINQDNNSTAKEAGGNAPHTNMPPWLAVSYMIKARTGGRASEEDFTSLMNGVNGALDRKLDIVNYSTEEQWTKRLWEDDRKMYFRTFNVGLLPNSGSKTIPHGISGFDFGIKYYGVSKGLSGGIPYMRPIPRLQAGIDVWANNVNLVIVSTADTSIWTQNYVVVEYVCTDR